jgi:hypothetical protein
MLGFPMGEWMAEYRDCGEKRWTPGIIWNQQRSALPAG